MGCWNGSCNLTNVSISHNDEVVGIIVKLNMVSGNACYINTHSAPEYLPVVGKYNDYGAMEDIKKDFNTKFICKEINTLLKNENIEKRFDDYYYKGEDLDIEGVITLVERGLHLDGIDYGLSMVIKDVYDEMTDVMNEDMLEYISLKIGTNSPRAIMTSISELSKEYGYDSLDPGVFADMEGEDLIRRNEYVARMKEIMDSVGDDSNDEVARKNQIGWVIDRSGSFTNGMENYTRFLNDSLTKDDRDLVGRFCSYAFLLSKTRKTWCNTSGMGSQDDNHETISKLADATKSFALKKLKEQEEW